VRIRKKPTGLDLQESERREGVLKKSDYFRLTLRLRDFLGLRFGLGRLKDLGLSQTEI